MPSTLLPPHAHLYLSHTDFRHWFIVCRLPKKLAEMRPGNEKNPSGYISWMILWIPEEKVDFDFQKITWISINFQPLRPFSYPVAHGPCSVWAQETGNTSGNPTGSHGFTIVFPWFSHGFPVVAPSLLGSLGLPGSPCSAERYQVHPKPKGTARVNAQMPMRIFSVPLHLDGPWGLVATKWWVILLF